jgi:hypothetical protein
MLEEIHIFFILNLYSFQMQVFCNVQCFCDVKVLDLRRNITAQWIQYGQLVETYILKLNIS